MSRLEELIQELCPDGVDFYPLNKVTHYAKKRIDASRMYKATYVGVENLLQNKQGKTEASSVPESGSVIAFEAGDILIGNIRPYLRKIWLADCSGGTNGDVLTVQVEDKTSLIPKFLYYVLSSEEFFLYDIQNSKGAKMPRGSKEAVMSYQVPVPPLPVQSKIVQILDNLTKFTTELTTELTMELAARKMQYEYYRDKLLTFNVSGGVSDCKWRTIEQVCKSITSGGTPKSKNATFYGGTIPWLRTQEVDWVDIHDTEVKITDEGLLNSSARWIPQNCVIVAMYGATAAKVAINKIPLTTNQACCNLEIDENEASYRYVFHWLSKEYLTLKSLGQGSQSNINAQIIRQYPIPIPSLSIQQRIIFVLDHLDTLCSNLTSSLLAEIASRQKQYEYYRDKLLTFKEKTS